MCGLLILSFLLSPYLVKPRRQCIFPKNCQMVTGLLINPLILTLFHITVHCSLGVFLLFQFNTQRYHTEGIWRTTMNLLCQKLTNRQIAVFWLYRIDLRQTHHSCPIIFLTVFSESISSSVMDLISSSDPYYPAFHLHEPSAYFAP